MDREPLRKWVGELQDDLQHEESWRWMMHCVLNLIAESFVEPDYYDDGTPGEYGTLGDYGNTADRPTINDDFPMSKDYWLEILTENWELRKSLRVTDELWAATTRDLDAAKAGRATTTATDSGEYSIEAEPYDGPRCVYGGDPDDGPFADPRDRGVNPAEDELDGYTEDSKQSLRRGLRQTDGEDLGSFAQYALPTPDEVAEALLPDERYDYRRPCEAHYHILAATVRELSWWIIGDQRTVTNGERLDAAMAIARKIQEMNE